MGYLLKEALKTLCGINQWSYAVFWKIGCQNPKLLIWEECYYGPVTCSKLPTTSGIKKPYVDFDEWEASWVSSETLNSQLGVQARERVQLLFKKMMMDNHVNVVGEGLVGRAAFTGNYQWIISQNYTSKSHPQEVLNELCHQFSAGMQTVAVIPVLPYGVLQLGSSSAIIENTGFVNDVKTLVSQLGCVPRALFSDSCATKEPTPKLGASVGLGKSRLTDSTWKSKVTGSSHLTSYISENYHRQGKPTASKGLGETSNVTVRQIQDNLQFTGSNFQYPRAIYKTNGQAEVIFGKNQLETGVANAEVIPSNLEVWLNQVASSQIPGPRMNHEQSNYGSLRFLEQQMLVNDVGGDNVNNVLNDSSIYSLVNDVSGDNVNNILNDSSIYSLEWRSNGGFGSSFHKGSSSVISHEQFDMHNGLRGHVSGISNASSLPSDHRLANTNITSGCMSGLQNVTQPKMAVSNSGFAENLTFSQLVFDSSDHKHNFKDKKCTKTELDDGKAEENDKYDAISILHCQSNEPINLSRHIPGSMHYGQKQDYGYQSMGLSDTQFEDAYVLSQSSDDLFDILGLNCKNKIFHESLLCNGQGTSLQILDNSNDASNKLQNVCSQSQLANQRSSDSDILSVTDTDHLLDAVVSKVQSATKPNSNDNLSCTTTLTKLSSSALIASTSTLQANASDQMQVESFGLSKSQKIWDLGSCSFNSGSCKQDMINYSQTSTFFGTEIGLWVEQGHDLKSSTSASTAYSKKTDETNKSNRKRLKPGENPRPRPKGRQMIQDRLKELREIVPNGAKCSIDALLECTIKHMLFLQCVTKHADKLKQMGDSKIISDEGGLLLKDNFEGGATWAYEVGSQAMVCPIIVEDLNPPRQLLVEMLCEERGLFLEIADIIRGLGLTILKGIMEARNDKIWARFAVEANRDVTRMELFISLVHLLEETVKSSSTPVNCIGNDNTSAHQSFPQAASIPATGVPCGFK